MSINWLENVEPKIKCWWMLIDYLKATMQKFTTKKNKVVVGSSSTLYYTIELNLYYNTFYDNNNLQTSFEYKLSQDGIRKFIDIEYGKNPNSYAAKISLKNNITKDDIEFIIGLLALFGYTETLNSID